MLKGLIIDTPHIDNIMSGRKTWEMRSNATKQRGPIALIRKGAGVVVGIAEIADSKGPLGREEMISDMPKHLIARDRIESGVLEKWKFAWVMTGARSLPRPVPYRHPSGAVIWVNLDEDVRDAILKQSA